MLQKRSAQSLLFESAMELISYYPLQQVSVQDIAKHCNVSTRTFYNHFKDKHDLVEKSYVYLLENYFSSEYVCHGDKKDLHSWLMHTATQIFHHYDYFAHIAQFSGQNNFRISIYKPFQELFIRFFEECKGVSLTSDQQNALSFFLYGMIGSVESLLLRHQIYTPDEMVHFFELSIPEILKSFTDPGL